MREPEYGDFDKEWRDECLTCEHCIEVTSYGLRCNVKDCEAEGDGE